MEKEKKKEKVTPAVQEFLNAVLVTKSRIRSQYQISKHDPVLKEDYLEDMVRREVLHGLTKEFDKNNPISVSKEEDMEHVTYSVDAIVFDTKTFKQVLDAYVAMLKTTE